MKYKNAKATFQSEGKKMKRNYSTSEGKVVKRTLSGIFWAAIFWISLLAVGGSGAWADSGVLQAAGVNALPPGESEMILIPEGEFIFGSSDADVDQLVKDFFAGSRDWYLNEYPAQKVYMGAYYIDKFETTVAQYQKFIKATNRPAPKYSDNEKFNGPNQPAVGMSWKDARDYCEWAGKRLPNEAHWEKAARGTDGRRYPWGQEIDPSRANVRGKKDGFRYASEVGSFPQGQSPYGVMDMAGNVWEWMDNWYMPYPGNQHKNDAYGKTMKVIRGGAWYANMDLARSTTRGQSPPERKHNTIGFRCVKTIQK